MMYNIQDYLGKVVTLRTNKSEEIIAVLEGVNEERTVLTVSNPMLVMSVNQEATVIPFSLTGDTKSVNLNANNILAIMPTIKESAEVYSEMVQQTQEAEVEVLDDA